MSEETRITNVDVSEWAVLRQQAEALVASGLLPSSINTWQKAVAIMLLGRELGVGPWAALGNINVIQNKPTISPQLMLALINRSGQLEDMKIEDDGSACTVTLARKGRTPHHYSFSMSDAQSMGLVHKDNWKKQPLIMRQWRAVAGCARVVFADVILGLYTPEEMGAVVIADEQGNMTIVEDAPPPPPVAALPAPVQPGEPSPLDWQNEAAEDAPATNEYAVGKIKVVAQGQNKMYLLNSGKVNIAMYGGERLRDIGLDTDTWKQHMGQWFELEHPLRVIADLDGKKWNIHSIEVAS